MARITFLHRVENLISLFYFIYLFLRIVIQYNSKAFRMHLLFAANIDNQETLSFLTFPRLGSGSMSIMQSKHLLEGEREEQFKFFWQKGDVHNPRELWG